VYGGADTQLQRRALRRGVDIIIGTPGRVNDFIERGDLTLKDVEVFGTVFFFKKKKVFGLPAEITKKKM